MRANAVCCSQSAAGLCCVAGFRLTGNIAALCEMLGVFPRSPSALLGRMLRQNPAELVMTRKISPFFFFFFHFIFWS